MPRGQMPKKRSLKTARYLAAVSVCVLGSVDSLISPEILSSVVITWHPSRGQHRLGVSGSSDNYETSWLSASPRKQQNRRKTVNRRPKYYWTDPANLRKELCEFWTAHGVYIENDTPPTIPNEVILRHYERHDLRAAIVTNGGRETVSRLIGGAPIMAGRWQEAIQQSPELRALIHLDPSLCVERPPHVGGSPRSSSTRPWSHQSGRKPKGYWSLQSVVQELYEYVEDYRNEYNRPAVWMPRPSELGNHGRDDLRQALNRFGGASKICRLAGMVPYREWYYFEGQLELLTELKSYLDKNANSTADYFPKVEDIRRDGYEKLYSLIQYYGGRKFLAARLGMTTKLTTGHASSDDLNFGEFDLDFAIRLLCCVRTQHLGQNPPLKNPALAMPSQLQLIGSREGLELDQQIKQFGGYENVARRLGLAVVE